MATILIVCTGNICRSPMAKGLLHHLLRERQISTVSVSSAGTAAWDDNPPTPEAVRAMRERDMDIASHLARRARPEMVRQADLVVTMTAEQADTVAEMAPDAADRVFTLKELVNLLDDFPGHDGNGRADQRLYRAVAWSSANRGSLEGRRPYDDVPDPLGLGLESYRATAWELGELCQRLVDGLFGPGWEEHFSIDSAALWG